MKKNDEHFMLLAIKEARKNLKTMEGGPFGACIVKRGRVLAVARNTVLKNDATCHAEINAIRKASKLAGSFDLSNCVMYTTTEPCPMCFAAIHWARIGKIVYGTNIADASKIGFNEFKVSSARLKSLGKSSICLKRSSLLKECRQLFSDWHRLPHKQLY
ncbi:MAG TPA: nucleoside deaminase [Candidatus Omnitrophota bacterium]|nr:nucleoside deaminase [Candidatus Omnitrophota bacterium]HRZ14080.1 nucleoside deaminase [Candidatus Omnitrophota bacterium]